MNLDAEQREQRILTELLRAGAVFVNELAALLEVTPTTIRRDLTDLEKRGLLRRTHGGAVALEPFLYEPFRHNVSFQEQEQRHSEAKRRIGLAAAELVQDNEVIGISGGTTATQVARSIRYRKDITIVTNTVNVPMELANQKDITVVVTGGTLRGTWFSLVGPNAVRSVSEVFMNRVFLGVDGVDVTSGCTSHYPDEAAVNRTLAAHARQRVIVTHHEKVGRIAQALICRVSDVDILITDADAPDALIAPLVDAGVDVRRV